MGSCVKLVMAMRTKTVSKWRLRVLHNQKLFGCSAATSTFSRQRHPARLSVLGFEQRCNVAKTYIASLFWGSCFSISLSHLLDYCDDIDKRACCAVVCSDPRV